MSGERKPTIAELIQAELQNAAKNEAPPESAGTKIDFEAINRHQVAIMSLKNELRAAKSFDDMIRVMAHIVDLERKIMTEKMRDNSELEHKKQAIDEKIDRARRRIKLYEYERDHITNTLEVRTENYRRALDKKVNFLHHLVSGGI